MGVPVLNVPGFLTHGGVRGSTTDLMYVDMNRQFPGDPDSMSPTRRAIPTFSGTRSSSNATTRSTSTDARTGRFPG